MWRKVGFLLGVVAACGHQVPEPDVRSSPASGLQSAASSGRASPTTPSSSSAATSSAATSSAGAASAVGSAAVGSPSSTASATGTASALSSASAAPSAEPPLPPGRCVVRAPATPSRPTPPKGPDPRCPHDPEGPFKLRHATVRVAGLDATVDVEVAERDEHRTRGLMFRKDLAEGAGMLFVFEGERDLAFWMRNTCLPLDMLFIAADGLIVGIEENVPTLNDDNYDAGSCLSKYVLEVNAGWARRHGVKAGHKVILGGL